MAAIWTYMYRRWELVRRLSLWFALKWDEILVLILMRATLCYVVWPRRPIHRKHAHKQWASAPECTSYLLQYTNVTFVVVEIRPSIGVQQMLWTLAALANTNSVARDSSIQNLNLAGWVHPVRINANTFAHKQSSSWFIYHSNCPNSCTNVHLIGLSVSSRVRLSMVL